MLTRFTRLLSSVILVATVMSHNFVAAQSAASCYHESSSLIYHHSVSEVRLVFFPTDERNRPVSDLQKNDFAVVDDDNVIRDFRSFARADLINLDVVVLMDSSQSVLPRLPHEVADVQHLISQWPWRAGDKVSVLSFSGMQTRLICSEDCRSSFSAERIDSSSQGGATPLFDALKKAAGILHARAQPDVWRVIILFSDGDDTISVTSLKEALGAVQSSEAQVYAVDNSVAGSSNGSAILQKIARESGGRYLRLSDGAVHVFNSVIDDLHSARVVTYALPLAAADFHSIRILPTHNAKLQFRCRSGYYKRAGALTYQEERP
jgi:VWFA-related protein